MRTLVIGATGKTGTPLVHALAERGVAVRAASRHPSALASGVEPVGFDWSDRATWEPALNGIDGMYLIGPYAEADAAELVRELLAAAPQVRRVVLLSLLGVELLPDTMPMAGWEKDVRASGKEWSIIRPSWFQQNFGHGSFTAGIRASGELAVPAANGAAGFVDARDVADVAAHALTEDGHAGVIHTLTGPEALTHGQVLEQIGAAAGRKLRYVAVPPEEFAESMRVAGATDDIVAFELGLFQLLRDGVHSLVTDTVANVTGHAARSLSSYASEFATIWQ